ncbi:MAG: FkbM family methyltransferase [Opitutaceae bacterium]
MTNLRYFLGDILRRSRLLGRRDEAAAVQRLFPLLRRPKHQPGTITWQNHPLCYADASALYHQLSDIYIERAYDFTCDQPAPRILDVGGHIGLASLRLRQLFPHARLTTFEPDPVLANMLRTNLAAAGDAATELIVAAAWSSDGSRAFAATGDDSGALADHGSLQVSTVDFARFCLEPVAFLKLDVEGAEFELIEHLAATGALSQVRRVFIELHEWQDGPPRFHSLIGRLATAGFNYRLRSAALFGAEPQPGGFTAVGHPGNLVALYAWRD